MHRCGSNVLLDFIALKSDLKDNTKFLIWFKAVIQSNDFEYNN